MKVKFAAAASGAALLMVFALNAARAANSAAPAQAAPAAPAVAIPKVDPRADKLLTRMCEVIGSAHAFTFHAEVLFDQVLPSAVKVQYAGEIKFCSAATKRTGYRFPKRPGRQRFVVPGRQIDYL
jgi:hypothetical protein